MTDYLAKGSTVTGIIMPVDYVNYVKHSEASVEESCDVEFFCCMITHLPTPPLLRRLLWLNVATNYYFIHHIRRI